MARRKRQEEHENHERWLVSYADFITLLFAFFVVMYSISSVNDGKYRVLSNTLTDAFQTAAQSLDPIQLGEQVRTLEPVAGEYAAPASDSAESVVQGQSDSATDEDTVSPLLQLGEIKNSLESALSSYADQNLVNITQTRKGIEVEMKSKMLFKLGSARLSRDALKALRSVARIIKPLSNNIHVEGHTDDLPIKTVTYPSNWELSAARAASVVHIFGRYGVDPGRMAAIGYGEHQPLVDNKTELGRQKNRRVAVIIMADLHERKIWESGNPSQESAQ